ncbi:MAG: hypothetical protein HW394_149 [Acidobacteria bacterium]|nr:hypothetical protein [Acidobacteriota bacterium]
MRRGALAFLLVLGSQPAAPQGAVTGLTAAPELARVYNAIFDARFADVPALLTQACGPAPREACQVLDAVGLWWQIQLDPFNTTRDAGFQSRVEAAIAATEAWTAREPERAEAWFYLGGAYGARVQWRVLRGARLAAARDGTRIRDALERASALDPSMADAYFGIGLYRYYAAAAPAALRMLRWLLLLPGGDRALGLEQMGRARSSGLLMRSEADYQLHVLYLWYERQPGPALDLLAGLIERHPRNPHFRQAAADLHDVYLHDLTASLRSWEALLDAARAGRVAEPEMAETAARLGIARQLDRLSRSEGALEHLRAVIAARPGAPFGAVSRAHLQLGDALDRLGRRDEAATAYRAAIAETGARDPLGIAARARTALRAIER